MRLPKVTQGNLHLFIPSKVAGIYGELNKILARRFASHNRLRVCEESAGAYFQLRVMFLLTTQ